MTSRRDIQTQFNRAKRLGWLPFFLQAAQDNNFSPEVLLAIGSRETNLDPKYLKIKGDGGNGFGLMQIDRRSYSQWCASGAWHDPEACISKGAEVLAEKRREVANHFKADDKPWSEDDLLRIAVAGYNGGTLHSYDDFIAHGDPDRRTTGHDYSADVLERAEWFRDMLGPESEKPQESTDGTAMQLIKSADEKPEVPADAGATATPDGAKPGAPAPPEAAKQGEAIVGGRPDDKAVQASQGGNKSVWATVLGVITGIIAWFQAHSPSTQTVAIICVTVLILILIFRQVVMDAIRMFIHSDPARYNVK